MNIISKNIKWLMLASGVLTCTMLQAVFAPESTLNNLFGESLSGPLAAMIVRSWGVLIVFVGLMLIYGAFNPPNRKFAAVIAASSKIIFAILVVSLGDPYLTKAGIFIGFDTVVACILFIYIFTAGQDA